VHLLEQGGMTPRRSRGIFPLVHEIRNIIVVFVVFLSSSRAIRTRIVAAVDQAPDAHA
jgi:hypothetical protein